MSEDTRTTERTTEEDTRTTEDDARTTELVKYLKAAREKHITYKPAFIPDFLSFEVDTDVSLMAWGKTMHTGLYFLHSGDDPSVAPVYVADFTLEKMDGDDHPEEETQLDSGINITSVQASIHASLSTIEVDGRPLKFLEILSFLAMQDATSREECDHIFKLAFNIVPKHGEGRRKRRGKKATSAQVALLDPLTNAITETGPNAIQPADYFVEGGREINTGGGGVAILDIRAGKDADLEDLSSFNIDDRTRFWLDHLYPLLLAEGRTDYEVHGSEILMHAGLKNPYDPKSQEVMADAARNISKAMSTRIGIDVTKEKRSRRGNNARLIKSVEIRPIVDGTMTLDTYEVSEKGEEGKEGGKGTQDIAGVGEKKAVEVVRDFTVVVRPRMGETVLDALPLAQYAQSRGMLANFTQDEISFKGLHQTLEHRQMWAYVLRRIKARGISGTILFKTMWRDLQLDKGTEEAQRKKHERMLRVLEKMLDQKKGDIFASWSWKKDADGRVVGIKITRKKARKPSEFN